MRVNSNPLDALLDQTEAVIEAGAGTYADVGKAVMPESSRSVCNTRAWEWIRGRKRRPNGDAALKMQAWTAGKLLEITADKELGKKFRAAHKEIQKRGAEEA